MRAYTWQPHCVNTRQFGSVFFTDLSTQKHTQRDSYTNCSLHAPGKKSVLLQQKVEKRGSQNVNVFARVYLVTHKFLTANIGYAYLFQLFGFHKSVAFCFRVSLALRILAFFSLVHFFVEKWSSQRRRGKIMKNRGIKAISSRNKSFNKMQTEIKLTNISKTKD